MQIQAWIKRDVRRRNGPGACANPNVSQKLHDATYTGRKACYDANSDLTGGGGEHPVAKTTAAAI